MILLFFSLSTVNTVAHFSLLTSQLQKNMHNFDKSDFQQKIGCFPQVTGMKVIWFRGSLLIRHTTSVDESRFKVSTLVHACNNVTATHKLTPNI